MADSPRKSPGAGWQKSMLESSPYVGLGFQLAGAVLIYVGIGFFVDRWLDTSPWGLVTGAVVGMIAFFLQLVRVVRRMNAETHRGAGGKKYREFKESEWADGPPERDEWKEKWKDDWDRDKDWGADRGGKVGR
ncbi:MAG: F0F1-type ATP synthase assembly protein I [Rhodothermales bacterium]